MSDLSIKISKKGSKKNSINYLQELCFLFFSSSLSRLSLLSSLLFFLFIFSTINTRETYKNPMKRDHVPDLLNGPSFLSNLVALQWMVNPSGGGLSWAAERGVTLSTKKDPTCLLIGDSVNNENYI